MKTESFGSGARCGAAPYVGAGIGERICTRLRKAIWTVLRVRMQARMQRW
ncbi:hypothetical protein B0G84_0544 [Paraburkholderia sp. BL8N3]|nr:hypothetical protein B0G84_0544 [Paraburkholderia sp. BL8N3]